MCAFYIPHQRSGILNLTVYKRIRKPCRELSLLYSTCKAFVVLKVRTMLYAQSVAKNQTLNNPISAPVQIEPVANTLDLPIINNHPIRMNQDGLLNLNDLHKAAGSPDNKIPSQWLVNKSTKELVAAYQNGNSHSALKVNNGGNEQGVWAIEELLIDYAQWISIPFKMECIKVLKAYSHGKLQPQTISTGNPLLDALVQTQLQVQVQNQQLTDMDNRLGSIETKIASQKVEDQVPVNMARVSAIHSQLDYYITMNNLRSVLKRNLGYQMYNITTEVGIRPVEHWNITQALTLMGQIFAEAKPIKEGHEMHTHPLMDGKFKLTIRK